MRNFPRSGSRKTRDAVRREKALEAPQLKPTKRVIVNT